MRVTAIIDGSIDVPAELMFPTTTAQDWAPHRDLLTDDGLSAVADGRLPRRVRRPQDPHRRRLRRADAARRVRAAVGQPARQRHRAGPTSPTSCSPTCTSITSDGRPTLAAKWCSRTRPIDVTRLISSSSSRPIFPRSRPAKFMGGIHLTTGSAGSDPRADRSLLAVTRRSLPASMSGARRATHPAAR